MKKYVNILLFLICSTSVFSQHYETLNVLQIENGRTYDYCNSNELLGVIIYGEPNCNPDWQEWQVNSQYLYGDSIVITNIGEYVCTFIGCELNVGFNININDSYTTENPFTEPIVWKRQGNPITLSAGSSYYFWEHGLTGTWSNGETGNEITVTEPGVYSITISDLCGSSTYTVEVRDNVEIELATCDLESNLNMVTWRTTPAQAEYVSQVQIKRDGMVINTVDYSAGTFIDNIGSDAASRTYTITAIGTDGVPCPIESHPKETIHMAYLTGINNTIEVNWNTPTGYNLMGYNICEWHENDGSLNVIDYVGASVTSYTCSESQFDEGYIVVQGVEAGKDGETRLLSNHSLDLVGIGENETTAFKVYPNPANGVLFVETVCTPSLPVETYRIKNPIGQTVMQGEITSEKQQIDVRNLSKGVYFITVGVATRKFVVE